jgi:hypothetical protein
MAETSARERRAAAREERRASGQPQGEERDGADVYPDPTEALRTAASAAIAGAAVGAAQALARRRRAGDAGEDEPEPEAAAAEDEPDTEEVSDPEPVSDTGERERERDEPEPRPVAAGDARRIVDDARRQLRDLRGSDAESVSSIRRTRDGWCVGLEVVEVRRIPESTDVLATYEVTLDDDGNLITFERAARYYRSEADRR